VFGRRRITQSKGFWALPALAATVIMCLVAPSFADARGGIVGFVATKQSPKSASTEPAISPAPSNSKNEWFTVSNGDTSSLLSISKSGKIKKVASSLEGGKASTPSYGSAVIDGYDWVVRYGASSSPLYAVSASGKVKKVESNIGSDITDITTGTKGTLNFSSSDPSVGIESCTVSTSTSLSVDCQPPFSLGSLLGSLIGFLSGKGKIESLASHNGLLWFTDSTGQLGTFNLLKELLGGLGGILSDLFNGPYGDSGSGASAVGEGSATADTITAKNGDVYIAGGQFQSKAHRNNEIIKVNPKTGQTVKVFSKNLTDVTSIGSGAGNDVWFLDRKSSTSGRVGKLDVKTGKITQYKLPKGFKLEKTISQIAPGPQGSDAVYFTLETKAGKAAIGEAHGS
jgi:hypothetical protein